MGVGVGVFLLFVVLTLVALIVAVLVKRKAASKHTGCTKMRDSAYYNNSAVFQQKIELEENGLDADYDDVGEDKEKVSIVDGFDPYEDVDSKAQIKRAQKPTPKESSTPASATNIGELYAVVDKSKKAVKKKEGENGPTVTKKDDLYAMPMKKKGKMTDEEEGKVVSSGAEKGDEYDDAAGLKYEPKADSESQQQSEGDSKAPNVDVLYAVVDKSFKKKK